MKRSLCAALSYSLLISLSMLLSPDSFADTITMKSSVKVEGIVKRDMEDYVEVLVGDRLIKLRKNEIHSIEKNSNDGTVDFDALQKEADEQDKLLTQQTGLDRHQREDVLMYIVRLSDPDATRASESKRALVAMGAKHDLLPFIEFILPSYLPNTVCHILKLLGEITPDAAQRIFLQYIYTPDEHVRSTCVELLDTTKNKEARELIFRAFLDHTNIVKISACKVLARMGAKEATALLLTSYNHFDPWVEHNTREALVQIWSADPDASKLEKRQDWEVFWEEKQQEVPKTINLENLEPLVPPSTHHPGC